MFSRTGRRVIHVLRRTASSSKGETPSPRYQWALAVRDSYGRERLVSPWLLSAMLPQDWALDDEAVLGFWLEHGQMNQNVLATWPIGSMMATRPSEDYSSRAA